MKKYADKTVCVYDNGLYFSVAQKLANDFGKVYYYTPWEGAFPTSNETLLGSGFPNVERINRFFDKVDEVDLFVFPFIYNSDLQKYLVKQGKRVWGCREGDSMEIYRWDFLQYMIKLGMNVAPTELVIGIDNLRKHLKQVEDKFVKTDAMTRGDIETFHHLNYDITEPILDKLAYELGPKQNSIRFIVQDPIPTVAEIGYDGYCIDGKFPDECLFGIEVKDKGYVGEVRKYSDLPKEIKEINDALSETFKAYGYRGMFSSEIRIGEDGKAYLIDPTCRFPSPPTSVVLEMYENLAEILWDGADGNLVQPVFAAKFGAEIIGTSEFLKEGFMQIFYPEDDAQFVKQANVCMIDKKTYAIPKYPNFDWVCEVVAVGDTIEQTIADLKDRCDRVKGYKLNLDCSVLDGAIDAIKKF